jgi:ElaB/YqjD/DUF883 family membrane-anchored ribosome-binding protein
METTAKVKQESEKTGTQTKSSTEHARSSSQRNEPNQVTEKVDQAKQVISDAYDQTSKTISNVYDQTSKTLNSAYNHTLDYGRENPGKTLLIAFGVGVGVGLLLSNNTSRSRTSRIVPPVMNAISQIAAEIFR